MPDPLPPGLQIDPIRAGSVPVNRKQSVLVSALLVFAVSKGALYIAERGPNEPCRPRVDFTRSVGLLLQEEAFPVLPPAGGGGQASTPRGEQAEVGMGHAANPIAYRMDPLLDPLDPIVRLAATPALAEIKPGDRLSLLPSGGTGNGLGNGVGSGIGNGVGSGRGLGGRTTWIHSATGGQGIQIPMEFLSIKHYLPPEYPESARLLRLMGDVVIEVTIDEDGKPIAWKVLEGHPAFAAASLKVLPRWLFIPVVHEGRKVIATFEVRIRFTLV